MELFSGQKHSRGKFDISELITVFSEVGQVLVFKLVINVMKKYMKGSISTYATNKYGDLYSYYNEHQCERTWRRYDDRKSLVTEPLVHIVYFQSKDD